MEKENAFFVKGILNGLNICFQLVLYPIRCLFCIQALHAFETTFISKGKRITLEFSIGFSQHGIFDSIAFDFV